MDTVVDWTVAASVAVMVQKPTATDDVYVTVAWPLASVLAGLPAMVPQVPLEVKVTASPETAVAPTPVVTVAVIVEVDAPSPLMVEGVAVRLMLFGTGVWVMFAGAAVALPPLASVAETAQTPAVVDGV